MTSSSTDTKKTQGSPSHNAQEGDWVIVKEDRHPATERFELIDAAEARCWCGGPDAERCREQGHSWPLCNIDQGALWPRQTDEMDRRPHEEEEEEEGDEAASTDPAGGQREADDSEGAGAARDRPGPQKATLIPVSDENGPFTKLAVLTELLENGRLSGV